MLKVAHICITTSNLQARKLRLSAVGTLVPRHMAQSGRVKIQTLASLILQAVIWISEQSCWDMDFGGRRISRIKNEDFYGRRGRLRRLFPPLNSHGTLCTLLGLYDKRIFHLSHLPKSLAQSCTGKTCMLGKWENGLKMARLKMFSTQILVPKANL
jgi:hypothetical protein